MKKTLKIDKKKVAKAAQKTADYTKDNWKTILIITGVLGGIYAITKIVKTATSLLPDFNDNDINGGGGNPVITGDTIPPGSTISYNEAQQKASALFQAMDQFGTDEEKIFQTLSNVNMKGYTMVSQAFGKPRYGGFTVVNYLYPPRDLTYWLNAELSNRDYQKVVEMIKNN